MKISIIGYGAMGKVLENCIHEEGIGIASIIDPCNPEADFTEINEESLKNTDVCICFTTPSSALENIIQISKQKKQIVMATTGWLDQMNTAKKYVEQNQIGMVYSSNFSLGVNLFFKLVQLSSELINRFNDYDVLGYEMHHHRKKDSPSGTAKTIEKIILENFTRKKKVVEEKLERSMEKEEFHFASVRGGDIPGLHAVQFESNFDSIELKHTARNRIGFAKGSILAAKWILNKKGIFTEGHLMDSLLRN